MPGPSDAAVAGLEASLTEALNAAVENDISDSELVRFIGVRLMVLGGGSAASQGWTDVAEAQEQAGPSDAAVATLAPQIQSRTVLSAVPE